MNLAQTLAQLKKDTARHLRAFADARGRQAALAPYDSPDAVLVALAPASPLDVVRRNALVVALLEEHQRGPHPLWQAVLAGAFEPMLRKLRRRIGRPRDEDYDACVLQALLEALRSVRPSPYVLLAIRRATEESLFRGLRRHGEAPEVEAFDEERHAADPFGAEARAKEAAEEIARVLGASCDTELLDAIVATYVNDESLRDHIARTRAHEGNAAREAAYQRLWRARSEITNELRARLRPSPAKRPVEAA